MSASEKKNKSRYFHPNRTQPFIITFFMAVLAFKKLCKSMKLRIMKNFKPKHSREKSLFIKEIQRTHFKKYGIQQGHPIITLDTVNTANDEDANPYYEQPTEDDKKRSDEEEDDDGDVQPKKKENIIFTTERQLTKYQIERTVSRPKILEDKLEEYIVVSNDYYRKSHISFDQHGQPYSRIRHSQISNRRKQSIYHQSGAQPQEIDEKGSKQRKRGAIQMSTEDQIAFHNSFNGLFQTFVSKPAATTSTSQLASVRGALGNNNNTPNTLPAGASTLLTVDTNKANEVAGLHPGTTNTPAADATATDGEANPELYVPPDSVTNAQILEHGDYVEGTTLYYGSTVALQARHGGFLSFNNNFEVKASGHKILSHCKYVIKKSDDLNDNGMVKYGHALWLQAVTGVHNTINCVLGAQYASLTQGSKFHRASTDELNNPKKFAANKEKELEEKNNTPTASSRVSSQTTTARGAINTSSASTNPSTNSHINEDFKRNIEPLLIPFRRANMLKAQQYGRWVILHRDNPLGTLGKTVNHLDKIILEQEWFFLASHTPGNAHMYKSNLNNSDEIMEMILSSNSSQLVMNSGLLQLNLLNMQQQIYSLHQEKQQRILSKTLQDSTGHVSGHVSGMSGVSRHVQTTTSLGEKKIGSSGEESDWAGDDADTETDDVEKHLKTHQEDDPEDGEGAEKTSQNVSKPRTRTRKHPTTTEHEHGTGNGGTKKKAHLNTNKLLSHLFKPNEECCWKVHLVKLPVAQNDYYRSNQETIINANNQIIYSSENRMKKQQTLLNSLTNQLSGPLQSEHYLFDHYPKFASLPFNEQEITNLNEMTRGTGLDNWSKLGGGHQQHEKRKSSSPVKVGSTIHKRNSRSPIHHHMSITKELMEEKRAIRRAAVETAAEMSRRNGDGKNGDGKNGDGKNVYEKTAYGKTVYEKTVSGRTHSRSHSRGRSASRSRSRSRTNMSSPSRSPSRGSPSASPSRSPSPGHHRTSSGHTRTSSPTHRSKSPNRRWVEKRGIKLVDLSTTHSHHHSHNTKNGNGNGEESSSDPDDPTNTLKRSLRRKEFEYKKGRFLLSAKEEEYYYLQKYRSLQKHGFLKFQHSEEFLSGIYGRNSPVVKLFVETRKLQMKGQQGQQQTSESGHVRTSSDISSAIYDHKQGTGGEHLPHPPHPAHTAEEDFGRKNKNFSGNFSGNNFSGKSGGDVGDIRQWAHYTRYTNDQLRQEMLSVEDAITQDMLGTVMHRYPTIDTTTSTSINNTKNTSTKNGVFSRSSLLGATQPSKGTITLINAHTRIGRLALLEKYYWAIAQYLLLSPGAYAELPHIMSKYYELNYLKKLFAAKIIKKYCRFFYMQKTFTFGKEMQKIDLLSQYRIVRKEQIRKQLLELAGSGQTTVATPKAAGAGPGVSVSVSEKEKNVESGAGPGGGPVGGPGVAGPGPGDGKWITQLQEDVAVITPHAMTAHAAALAQQAKHANIPPGPLPGDMSGPTGGAPGPGPGVGGVSSSHPPIPLGLTFLSAEKNVHKATMDSGEEESGAGPGVPWNKSNNRCSFARPPTLLSLAAPVAIGIHGSRGSHQYHMRKVYSTSTLNTSGLGGVAGAGPGGGGYTGNNTGNSINGNTGNSSGNIVYGNTGNTVYGNTGNIVYGNTGNIVYGNTGNIGSGYTGNTTTGMTNTGMTNGTATGNNTGMMRHTEQSTGTTGTNTGTNTGTSSYTTHSSTTSLPQATTTTTRPRSPTHVTGIASAIPSYHTGKLSVIPSHHTGISPHHTGKASAVIPVIPSYHTGIPTTGMPPRPHTAGALLQTGPETGLSQHRVPHTMTTTTKKTRQEVQDMHAKLVQESRTKEYGLPPDVLADCCLDHVWTSPDKVSDNRLDKFSDNRLDKVSDNVPDNMSDIRKANAASLKIGIHFLKSVARQYGTVLPVKDTAVAANTMPFITTTKHASELNKHEIQFQQKQLVAEKLLRQHQHQPHTQHHIQQNIQQNIQQPHLQQNIQQNIQQKVRPQSARSTGSNTGTSTGSGTSGVYTVHGASTSSCHPATKSKSKKKTTGGGGGGGIGGWGVEEVARGGSGSGGGGGVYALAGYEDLRVIKRK